MERKDSFLMLRISKVQKICLAELAKELRLTTSELLRRIISATLESNIESKKT